MMGLPGRERSLTISSAVWIHHTIHERGIRRTDTGRQLAYRPAVKTLQITRTLRHTPTADKHHHKSTETHNIKSMITFSKTDLRHRVTCKEQTERLKQHLSRTI